MKYFTKELWADSQKKYVENKVKWQRVGEEYRDQLNKLQHRLNQSSFDFFLSANVHDGELLELLIEDGGRVGPISESPRQWNVNFNFPVKIKLSVLDAQDEFIWELRYKSIQRFSIEYPSNPPLFYSKGEGFGDWGYHELTDAGDGFLRHEILFATGSTILIEFKDLSVLQIQRSSTITKSD